MKFPERGAKRQTVRLAALGIDLLVLRNGATPAPRPGMNAVPWWRHVILALAGWRRTGTSLTAASQAEQRKMTAAVAPPSIPVSGGARIYVFPRQPGHRRIP